MNNIIQLVSLVFSFFYGMFFSFLTTIFKNYLFNNNIFFKIIFTFLFIFDICILYMYLLLKINSGYIHIYFIIMMMLGFIFYKKKFIVLIKRITTKYHIEKKS